MFSQGSFFSAYIQCCYTGLTKYYFDEVFLFYVITGRHYFLNAYRFKLDVSFNRQIL